MKLIKVCDYDAMSKLASEIIKEQINLKKDTVLGLATGSTPLRTYEYLIKDYENKELDFSQVKSVNLDEYIGIDKENKQSYYYFMKENLFNHINIKLENTNILNGMESDSKKECSRYDKVIEDLNGIDLQILGLGLNGHIGFNEPGTNFDIKTHEVDLEPSTIEANKRFFTSIDEVPKKAYTVGIKTIMEAKQILLLVSGEKKAGILKAMLEEEPTENIPATILNNHDNVTIIADYEATKFIDDNLFN